MRAEPCEVCGGRGYTRLTCPACGGEGSHPDYNNPHARIDCRECGSTGRFIAWCQACMGQGFRIGRVQEQRDGGQ